MSVVDHLRTREANLSRAIHGNAKTTAQRWHGAAITGLHNLAHADGAGVGRFVANVIGVVVAACAASGKCNHATGLAGIAVMQITVDARIAVGGGQPQCLGAGIDDGRNGDGVVVVAKLGDVDNN